MTQEIIKPLTDKKEYRFIQLGNGVRILLICEPLPGQSVCHDIEDASDGDFTGSEGEEEHDTQHRLAAAALCVNVGSFSDPENCQGLAHFLEHMLFLGSEKYPVENHFDDYLKSHSGNSNAFTEGEHTVYHFAVSQDHLRGALDIFASCLFKPLLLPNASDREIKAIQSEYEDNLLEDTSRRLQLFGMIAKHGHPFGGFPFGNTKSLIETPQSLGLDINVELRNFFQQHYTSDRMYLAVQSHHSLETMQLWVQEIFSPLLPSPTKNMLSPKKEWIFPFNEDKFNRLYRVCPARDMHELIITWALPSMFEKYLEKPHHYLSFIIGDEASGSLISFLRQKRLALQLVAGNDESGDEHNKYWCRFSLNIQLTDDGLASYEQVLRYVFAYMAMLQAMGPQQRIFDELKHINQFRFDYQDETEPIENVNNLCQYLKLYPEHHVLNGSFIFTEWHPESVEHCLSLMAPAKCNIILSSKFFESSLKNVETTEPWFKTRFSSEPLNPAWWSSIAKDDWQMFSLPAPNNFIPRDFTVKSLADGCVLQIPFDDETTGSRLWYKPGSIHFDQPKTCVSLLLFGDIFCNTLRNRIAVDIYLALLQLYLIEKLYPASVAGLKCSIKLQEFSKFGIAIRFSGFSDKLPALIDLVLNEIVNFSFTDDMFNIISTEIERDCRNSCVSPMDFGHQIRLATLLNDYCAKFQRLIPHSPNCYFNVEDFRAFLKDWRESHSCLLDCFISGNVDEDEAKNMFTKCKTILEPYLCSSAEAPTKELKLTQRSQCAKIVANEEAPVLSVHRFSVEDDENFAVVGYYQLGPGNFETFCISQLYEMIISEPCFNILRTQKQLGYNCFLEMHDTAGTLGFSVTIQSSHAQFNSKIVDEEIESFLASTVDYVASLSPSDFEDQVAALIELKLTPFGSLKVEARYYWAEICNRSASMFDRREREADFLESVTQADVVEFAKKLVTLRQKISFQVIGPTEVAESFTATPCENGGSTTGNSQPILCKPSAYKENGHGRHFVREFNTFKQSLTYNPHVDF